MLSETKFLLQGPVGNLEVVFAEVPEQIASRAATAVICHPHPLYGGTMGNKVVTTLAKTFAELGLRTVRFNFRGVGQSDGVFDNGIGETDDVFAVIKWVQQRFPNDSLWLAGFSFGAFVAGRTATQMSVAQLVTVAPQVSRFVEDKTPEIMCPWTLVQGEADEVISPEEVFAWIATRQHPPKVIRMPGAGHFFHGRLLELRELLVASFL